jgi:hypothetical protein
MSLRDQHAAVGLATAEAEARRALAALRIDAGRPARHLSVVR